MGCKLYSLEVRNEVNYIKLGYRLDGQKGRKDMKDMIRLVIVTGLIVLGIYVSNVYTRDVIVDSIEGNIVTFVDTADNKWEWETTDSESYYEGQEVRLVMSTLDTDDMTDDVILKIK